MHHASDLSGRAPSAFFFRMVRSKRMGSVFRDSRDFISPQEPEGLDASSGDGEIDRLYSRPEDSAD
ncbi:MAG TPA: hypothetical protein PLI31_04165 [Methanoregulaceae archaeon]|nr:hypothetical protein [Methanoregulaceae archaeon]